MRGGTGRPRLSHGRHVPRGGEWRGPVARGKKVGERGANIPGHVAWRRVGAQRRGRRACRNT
ncbi:hypothetical protein E2C01_081141 [Portunus trituberculatus]|uniref:Uncharacterized protein n=1 Tax=Portunus trituberculatus TaxID=210409 RepID=A0A5B7J0A4_PORTR|nr:hypothetical protein [Portunus trituberculatus]